MSAKKPRRFASFRDIGDKVRSHGRQRRAAAGVEAELVLRRSSLIADVTSTDGIARTRQHSVTSMDKRKSASEGDVGPARKSNYALVVAELQQKLQEQPSVTLRRQTDATQLLSPASRWFPNSRSKSYLYPRDGPKAGPAHKLARCINEGPVGRVKIAERDSRLPKHWTNDVYAYLAEDKLLYVGKEIGAVKEAASGGLPDTVVTRIRIDGALVKQTTTHSTKKNVLEVQEAESAGSARLVLLQNDDSNKTKEWYEALYKTAGRGGSLDRSKRAANAAAAAASATPVSDKNVRSAIGRFFGGGRRPTREALETRGIYRDEPVFGSKLASLCRGEGREPPQFVSECTDVLGRPPHVLQVGLYRTSGNLSHIQRLRLRVDQGDMSAVSKEQDTDVLAGALKLFFRELREPLLPYDTYVRLLHVTETASGVERVRSLLGSLPQAHLATLAALCQHLTCVIAHERDNQMNATSMAIVWGPSFTWPEETSQDAIVHCTRVNRVVEYLIVHEGQLFRRHNSNN